MGGGKWARAALLAMGFMVQGTAQGITVNDRLVELSDVLGKASLSGSATKIKAIEEIGAMKTISSLASGLLFDRASIRFEDDPLVREAAATGLRFVVDPRNRMGALRLGRLTTPAQEPDPRVRIAALRTLAAFESADAAACIYDAATEAKEPDPAVREAAKALINKGLTPRGY